VGKSIGRRKIGSKTLEGSAACFLGSLAGGIFFVNPLLAIIGALAAALAELIPRVDDNLTIPILAGLVMFSVSILV
jgi:dolichol kinase